MKNKSYAITAFVEMPNEGGDGVLVAAGGIVGGYTLFIKDRKPTYEYNWFSQHRYKVTSAKPLPVGPSSIRVEFEYDGGGIGKGGTAALFVNGENVGEGKVEKTVPARYSADETFDVGMDTGTPVSTDYASPNLFTGKLKKVEISLGASSLSEKDHEKVQTMERAAAVAAH